MKNEVAVFTTTDLQAAGINSQLTSNDLVEVIAHDIYNKITDAIAENTNHYNDLRKRYNELFDKEFDLMKKELLTAGFINAEEMKTVNENVYPENNRYWNNNYTVRYFSVNEKDKGTKIEDTSSSFGYVKGDKGKVRLNVVVNDYNKETDVKIKGIDGTIETTINKNFTKAISVTSAKYKQLFIDIDLHNKQVESLLKLLPTTGLLSVERFTREARVKMNKKIISAQSPDFRKKISELFNIKL